MLQKKKQILKKKDNKAINYKRGKYNDSNIDLNKIMINKKY